MGLLELLSWTNGATCQPRNEFQGKDLPGGYSFQLILSMFVGGIEWDNSSQGLTDILVPS